jgi:hypothetical protein
MKELKVRCSKLGDVFTNPKSKADKEAGNLSQTAKKLVSGMFLEEKYSYKELIFSNEIKKGNLCEQDSMQLVSDVYGGFRYAFKDNLENEWLTGTPDIVLDSSVEDIKTSYNIRTFHESSISKAYEYQLRGYMMLTNKEVAKLIYCLVPTPKEIIEEEKKRLYFKFDCQEDNPDYIEACSQIDHNNNIIKYISKELRVKSFVIKRDKKIEEEIKFRVEKLREVYKTIVLNQKN